MEGEQARLYWQGQNSLYFPLTGAIHMLINHTPIGHLGGLSENCILTRHNCSVNKSTNKDPEVWGDRGREKATQNVEG